VPGRIEICAFPEAEVPATLRAQVRAVQRSEWPGVGTDPVRAAADVAHDPALRPLSLLLLVDGRVAAALDILSKEFEHAGERYAASGLSTVVTDPAQRRRGHGHRLVQAAYERIAASGADLGLFTCDRPLAGFYEGAGWQVIPGAVLVGGTPDDPFPSDQWDKVTLGAFFSPRAQAHAGSFAHARIGLYPGTLDRLW
jgi:aminoglycoside 2'-N-acetyltransferase I